MKLLLSLVTLISFPIFAMRRGPVRPAAAKPVRAYKHTAPTQTRAEFLSPEHKACLVEIGANRHEKFAPAARERMTKILATLPRATHNNFAYNHALMALALKSAYLGNLDEELELAQHLFDAGANIDYSVQVQENDCFGSMDGVSASAPYHYRTETLRMWAKGDFENLLNTYNANKPKF